VALRRRSCIFPVRTPGHGTCSRRFARRYTVHRQHVRSDCGRSAAGLVRHSRYLLGAQRNTLSVPVTDARPVHQCRPSRGVRHRARGVRGNAEGRRALRLLEHSAAVCLGDRSPATRRRRSRACGGDRSPQGDHGAPSLLGDDQAGTHTVALPLTRVAGSSTIANADLRWAGCRCDVEWSSRAVGFWPEQAGHHRVDHRVGGGGWVN
jgi:hypothetical protein